MPDAPTETFGERCWRVLLDETARRGNAQPPLPPLSAAERQAIITQLHDADMKAAIANHFALHSPAAGLSDGPKRPTRKASEPRPSQQLLSDSIDPFGDRNIIPPKPEWVTAYSASVGYPMNGERWCRHYEARGWLLSSKLRMKDWQATVQNWRDSGWGKDAGITLRVASSGPTKPDLYCAPENWSVVLREVGKRSGLDAERIEEFASGPWGEVPLHLRNDVLKLKAS